ncbi:hypothetical protein JCM11641_002733 [Rhodosporidiobolus odoratus]
MKASTSRSQTQKLARSPRRRLRPSSDSHDTSASLPPARDLIGPPCPLSNLRPVYYAPLFPLLHASASSTSLSPHPYSLAEFPTTSVLSSRSRKQQRLQQVQRELHAQDLEWRLTRYRLDAFNQDFWARTNTQFLQARDAYLARKEAEAARAGPDGATFPPATSMAATPSEDVDLAPFYAEHLAATKKQYAEYNTALWRMQAALLWPAVRASLRRWRWKWEVWRAGGEHA